jgi:hypothetical protein
MAINQPVVVTLFYGVEAEVRHVSRVLENLDIHGDILQYRGKHPVLEWKIIFASKDPAASLRSLFQRKSVPAPLDVHTFDPQHQPEVGWGSSTDLALKELITGL